MTLDEALRMAVAHHQAGRLREAESMYRQILEQIPNQPDTMHMLGMLALHVKRPRDAEHLIEEALAVNPNLPGAWSNLGLVKRTLGDEDAALACFEKACIQEPNAPESQNNLGIALLKHERSAEAVQAFRRALAIQPKLAETWNNLGQALSAMRNFEEAVAAYQSAIAINPGWAPTHLNLGMSLSRLERLNEAEAAFRRALEIDPKFTDAWTNLATIMMSTKRYDEAMQHVRRALDLSPSHANANFTVGLLNLINGDLEAGWKGYERRFEIPDAPRRRFVDKPQWDGSPLSGRTLLVHPEQGYGDVIMFARFLPLVSSQCGGRVIVQCWPDMADLMRSVQSLERVAVVGDELPPFDLVLPIGSLPRAFGARVDSIPQNVPYLKPDQPRIDRFRTLLAPVGGRKVGLIWAGKPIPAGRSIDSDLLLPLANAAREAGAELISLQKPNPGMKPPPPELQLFDLAPELHDFADTAAAMSLLDLIISIDTAALHLAGALGCNTWGLLRDAADWRWLRDREDSPWYSTMRLFRQQVSGDWRTVVERVASELCRWRAA